MTTQRKARPPFPFYERYPTKLERTAYRSWNWFANRLWPVSPAVYGTGVAVLAAFQLRSIAKNGPNSILIRWLLQDRAGNVALRYLSTGALAALAAYLPVLALRQFISLFYFGYKGYLFENPKKPSFTTKCWGLVRKLLSFTPARLLSCDRLLRPLPVPPLEQTVDRYLDSVRHLHSEEEYAHIVELAHRFEAEEGRKLQFYCQAWSLFTENYVTPLWERYAYLYNRSGVLINSSVAHVDLIANTPSNAATRAAHITLIEVNSHLAIDREDYPPPGGGLVCTRHYSKLYAVTRIPGPEVDHLANYGISKHIIVLANGYIYKIDLCDATGKIYTADQFTRIYDEVLRRDEPRTDVFSKIPALTTDRRDTWAANRERFFVQNKNNAPLLKVIESAIFVMSYDDHDEFDVRPPEKFSKFLGSMLTGTGVNRWADKSLNYSFTKNARAGGTTEHSIGDGAEFDNILEFFVDCDLNHVPYPEMQDVVPDSDQPRDPKIRYAQRLDFEVNEEMAEEIERCAKDYSVQRDNVQLASTVFEEFGKGRVKVCRCSPDAFIQMAIQLANFKDQGRFSLTYEAASVRFFANSRTETLRTVSDESVAFVRAMMDGSVSREERANLLRAACDVHQAKNKECLVGRGVDRHLFVLYVLSKGTGVSSPFLDHYIDQPWLLSTSHVPNMTNRTDEDALPDKSWAGACFAPVARDGYGVCYRFAGNHSILIHISAFKDSQKTDADRLRGHITEAFREMSALFD